MIYIYIYIRIMFHIQHSTIQKNTTTIVHPWVSKRFFSRLDFLRIDSESSMFKPKQTGGGLPRNEFSRQKRAFLGQNVVPEKGIHGSVMRSDL